MEAFRQDALPRPVGTNDADGEFALVTPCESDEVATRRPDGSLEGALTEGDSLGVGAIGIHHIELR